MIYLACIYIYILPVFCVCSVSNMHANLCQYCLLKTNSLQYMKTGELMVFFHRGMLKSKESFIYSSTIDFLFSKQPLFL